MEKFVMMLLSAFMTLTLSAQIKNTRTDSFKVFGACEQCKHRIESSLSAYGTYQANWDIETQMLTVCYDSLKFTRSGIRKKLASVGHDTEEFQVTDASYKSLPKCCYYERYVKLSSLPVADSLQAQKNLHLIKGVILEETIKGKLLPLANATIHSLKNKQTTT